MFRILLSRFPPSNWLITKQKKRKFKNERSENFYVFLIRRLIPITRTSKATLDKGVSGGEVKNVLPVAHTKLYAKREVLPLNEKVKLS